MSFGVLTSLGGSTGLVGVLLEPSGTLQPLPELSPIAARIEVEHASHADDVVVSYALRRRARSRAYRVRAGHASEFLVY